MLCIEYMLHWREAKPMQNPLSKKNQWRKGNKTTVFPQKAASQARKINVAENICILPLTYVVNFVEKKKRNTYLQQKNDRR